MRHIARWDLDKTYLRTEFDTVRQLVRTAFERPDEKRTNPGAATVMRELARAGSMVHILSGSPEQMRSRIEAKLAIDGVRYESLVLKPNLQNILRLRFRAVKDQLGYKLSALLAARAHEQNKTGPLPVETLFGDDAEVDGFVYSVYGAIVSRSIDLDVVVAICQAGEVYADTRDEILASAQSILRAPAVERILIHLESRTPPGEFQDFGSRLVPSSTTRRPRSFCSRTVAWTAMARFACVRSSPSTTTSTAMRSPRATPSSCVATPCRGRWARNSRAPWKLSRFAGRPRSR